MRASPFRGNVSATGHIGRDARETVFGQLSFCDLVTRGAPGRTENRALRGSAMLGIQHPNSSQIRMARAGLCWTQGLLSRRAGVCLQTVKNLECGVIDARISTIRKILEALRAGGAEIRDDGSVCILGVLDRLGDGNDRQISPRRTPRASGFSSIQSTSDPVRAERVA